MRRFVLTFVLCATPSASFAQARAAGDYVDPLAQKAGPVVSATQNAIAVAIDRAERLESAAVEYSVFVGAVSFSGLEQSSPADFADLIASRVGREWSSHELRDMATLVAKRLRNRGYAFATASVDAQKVQAGVLRVRVDEGRIDEVRFDGDASPAVRRTLAPLVRDRAPMFAEIERRLMLAGDIDGTRIENSRYEKQGDRGVLIVRVSRDRVAARAGVNNAGTRPIGPVQARIEANVNGLLASDDSLSLTYSAVPAQPRELQFGYARYEKRISPAGTEIALTGTASFVRPGAYLAPLHIRNRSWYAAASVLQPIMRSRKASFWIEGEMGIRDLAQWRAGTRVRDDRVVTARLTLYGYRDIAGGHARVSGTLTQGLGVLGASTSRDALVSRDDADGTFSTASLWADWTRELGGKFSLRLSAQGQVSSQPLLISEEISLGGTSFLRGYDWGERSGDEGIIGMAELRYLWERPVNFVKRAQLYAYVDGGSVSNLEGGFGGGKLVTSGGGARVDVSNTLGVTLEVGVPLSGARYDTGNRAPKISFSVVRAF